jgi:hypothetical protein
MYDLDHFQLPHDPTSTHQLHWKPGSYGKGVIEEDGTVHTWPTGGILDGEPSHRHYMIDKGIGDPYPSQSLQKGTVKFWIKPEGEVEVLSDWGSPSEETYSYLQRIDPRLTPATDEFYRFADTQAQDRVLHGGGPPKMVGGYQPASLDAVQRNAYNGRTPFIYHAPENTVYVGRPGWHHDTVRSHYGLQSDPMAPNLYEGFATHGLDDHPDENNRWPSGVEWTSHQVIPDNHEEVLEAVADHTGLPADHADGNIWRFAATPAPTPEELTNMIMEMLPLHKTELKPDPVADQRAREKAEDPLGFEMRNDWDRPGDVESAERLGIEWVPTHALKPFLEYDRRPGGKDAWGNQERWDALGEHLKANGFKNPVWIDFNPDESTGHLSEGNHRVQLALDHGIPAVPVRVYRSRRPSPTQVKVTPKPEPQWEDQFDPTGYHYPDYMKPSHIGLPTVPPPDQRTAAYGDSQYNPETQEWNDFEHWEPGSIGKGLVYMHPEFNEPDLIAWKVDDWGNPSDPGYHHEDVVERFGLNGWGGDVLATIPDIAADGTFSIIADRGSGNQEYAEIVEQIDPRMKARDKNRWSFGRVATGRPMYHVAPTYARESIQRQGLMGHLLDHPSVESPWQQELGQPAGNYMFDDPGAAAAYITGLAQKVSPEKWTFPGDTAGATFEEHGIFPNRDYGDEFAYISPPDQEPPEDFHEWPDDKQDDWYEREHERRENDAVEYDHENPDHRGRLPKELQGWDIWEVNANGLPVLPDPEPLLQKRHFHQKWPDTHSKEPRALAPDEIHPDVDNYEVGDTLPPRWMTHEHVPPERLNLSTHVPSWAVNDTWAEDAMQAGYGAEVPEQYALLHPRHILPKGVPPEAREIWGKALDKLRQT